MDLVPFINKAINWKIGLIGFGNVGKAFIKLYSRLRSYWHRQYGINASFHFVLNSKGGIYNKNGLDIDVLTKYAERGKINEMKGWKDKLSFEEVFEQSRQYINLLVEVSPTNIKDGEPALSYIATALGNRISVVTGNKGPFLFKHNELAALAKKNNLLLGIGCTTAAALPTINFGIIDLAGCNIYKIEGILNGVCNFILTQMDEQAITLDYALNKAISMGISETNPSYDIDGWDTAVKTIIIANALMNASLTLNNIYVEGIRTINEEIISAARKQNKRIKLIGYAFRKDNGIEAGVKLKQVDKSNPLYNIRGTNKALLYATEPAGEFIITGGASSPEGAAYSLWRDILNYKSLMNKLY